MKCVDQHGLELPLLFALFLMMLWWVSQRIKPTPPKGEQVTLSNQGSPHAITWVRDSTCHSFHAWAKNWPPFRRTITWVHDGGVGSGLQNLMTHGGQAPAVFNAYSVGLQIGNRLLIQKKIFLGHSLMGLRIEIFSQHLSQPLRHPRSNSLILLFWCLTNVHCLEVLSTAIKSSSE